MGTHLHALLFKEHPNTDILNSVCGMIIFHLEIIMGKEQMEKFCPTDLNYLFYQNSSKSILLSQIRLSQTSRLNFKILL